MSPVTSQDIQQSNEAHAKLLKQGVDVFAANRACSGTWQTLASHKADFANGGRGLFSQEALRNLTMELSRGGRAMWSYQRQIAGNQQALL